MLVRIRCCIKVPRLCAWSGPWGFGSFLIAWRTLHNVGDLLFGTDWCKILDCDYITQSRTGFGGVDNHFASGVRDQFQIERGLTRLILVFSPPVGISAFALIPFDHIKCDPMKARDNALILLSRLTVLETETQ